jgi:GAF domain-containing protein/multidrug efflux pump subunit AcrA (membrane-fusion protein)
LTLASQEQDSILDLFELSDQLLGEQEVIPRARILAKFAAGFLGESAVTVYTLGSDGKSSFWFPKTTVGEASVHEQAIASDSGLMGSLLSDPSPVIRIGSEIKREDYPHIDTRRSLLSLCYIPLIHKKRLVGAWEILSFGAAISEEAIEALQRAAAVAATGILAAQGYEEERHSTLSSITRITQLYDLEKVFSSTLEMEELLPLIGSKFKEILECRAVNIWLVLPNESVELMHQAGEDPTTFKGQVLQAKEGIAGGVSDDGEPLCITDPSGALLSKRNERGSGIPVQSLIAAGILDRGALVGVIEAVNKVDGTNFDDDDLFTLSSLSDTASTALHNASLLMAERKVEILETLNTVSHEITSTLNLERMLQTIVNAPQAVIPYERAAIVLEQRGGFRLSAVTGVTEIHADSPDLAPLNELLQWAALSEETIHVRQHGEEIDADREETRAKFKNYFAQSGMRGFFARPLNDDTGRVGLLAMEASDPDFLGPAHIEILEVLAGQTTVALRNAQMYKEVPFISVLEPVLERKRRFLALPKSRRVLYTASISAALLFLIACPLPLRVDGDAVVAPLHRALVQPEIAGVVSKVFVREGQEVRRGQVLAEMESWNSRSELAEAQSKYETAMLKMNKALAANDGSEAGVARVHAEYWKAELDRTKELLAKVQLRALIDGVVSTPHVEEFAGRRLQGGETFIEIVDTSRAVVDVAIENTDAGLLKNGQSAVIKLNSYPLRIFRGNVSVISQRAEMFHEVPVFYSRVAVDNSDGAIRTGMEGRGKIRVGWRPAGYVFLRPLFIWMYSKVWYWVG